MEGYIHGLMAVYHARLLRSLSCVLGAHTREKERVCEYDREKEKEDKTAREKGRKSESKRKRVRERGGQ